jgi:uncharacterized RDD family membrane protein YckC
MNIEPTNQASNRHRAMAFTIDMGIVALAQLILGTLTLKLYTYTCTQMAVVPDFDAGAFLSEFCGGFFFISYFTFSVGIFGNTVGKKTMNLKVVYQKDGLEVSPTLRQAYWRSMGYLMSSWTYMIGFILPYFRKDKLALHDLLCGSRVVGQAPIEVSHEPQLLHPLHLAPRSIETRTTEQDQLPGRTGTDR